VSEDGEPLAELTYGDSAEIRVINLGRKRRKHQSVYGFWLDLIRGRWLSEKEASGDAPEVGDDLEASVEDSRRKALVVPYVEDRRNVLVVRWAAAVSDEEAWSLQYALERGIEATFQLEDSELLSERLPDSQDRGRLLMVEAAEGGAGVLRRLQSEPDAVPRAAAEALRIIHVDPATGEPLPDACVRGCYRCLLSYGNQLVHELIDRRLTVRTLMALAEGRTEPKNDTRDADRLSWSELNTSELPPRVIALLDSIRRANGRRPDQLGADIDGVRVDMVYELAPARTAVVIDVGHGVPDLSPLAFGMWNVIHVRLDDDPDDVVRRNLSVFGQEVR
jgi:hypothetical protein